MVRYILAVAMLFMQAIANAQTEKEDLKEDNDTRDSLYIEEVQNKTALPKILHAEPLYIDLIRDLGARKGEREWNVGMGITDNQKYDAYQVLVEYEWAPADRLGLEIEVPFTFHAPVNGTSRSEVPSHRMESLKTAMQYTFLVSERTNTSLAIGYINELELADLSTMRNDNIVQGNVFNPFFIAAKRWGNNFHTLIYTGPRLEKPFNSKHWHNRFDINTNLHYMIPGTRNFIGVEFNKELSGHDFDMTVRPQLRVSVADNLLIGIVAGIPVKRENERFSSFMRLIWEPGNKHH
jgi:hypothetical protein